MSSSRSSLLMLVCVLQTLPCSVACGGDVHGNGSAGAGTTAGAFASNVGGDSARSGAGGALAHAGGASGAAVGGAAASATGGAATGGAATGGAATGGAATAGASSGGAPSSGASGQAGAGAASGCAGLSQTRSARSGKSAGFSGGYQSDYYPLYSHACSALADCSAACVTAGGSPASCAASECIDSTPDYCLPPTYWFDFDRLLTETSSPDPSVVQEGSVWVIMVNNPYRDQLLASNFQFEIPSGAKILGISFSIKEAADSENLIADYSVRALSGAGPVGLDRGHTKPWTAEFHPEIYGGPADLWGSNWSPEAVNAASFGVALTPLYLDSAGNGRAYVDFITATVTYDVCQ